MARELSDHGPSVPQRCQSSNRVVRQALLCSEPQRYHKVQGESDHRRASSLLSVP
jgi:hypothetical protein